MTKTIYTQQIEQIVNAITITSLSTFKVHEEEEYVQHQAPYQTFADDFKSFGSNTTVDGQQQRANLINAVTNTIYARFYCAIKNGNHTSEIPPKDERNSFMETLSEANTSTGGLDYNWNIYSIDQQTGGVYIQKNDELRWLAPKSYQFANPHQKQPAINTKVHLYKQKENRNLQPVFYHVFSDALFPQKAEIARFYWNITAEGASKLIHLLTTTLNDYNIPFQFKCLNHPALYVRSDAAVLYIDKKHVQLVSIILKSVIPNLKTDLQEEIPMFTKKLYKGIGFAEDPGKGQSFGMSRATAIAEALVDAFLQQKNTEQTLENIIHFLAQKGMTTDRLHLNKHTALTPTFPSYD